MEVLGMLGSQVARDLPSQLRQLTPWGKHRFASHRHLQAELGQSLPLSQLGAPWAGKNENYVAVICGVLMGTSTTCSLYMIISLDPCRTLRCMCNCYPHCT